MDPTLLVAIGLVLAVALAVLLVARTRTGRASRADLTTIEDRPSASTGPTISQPTRIVVVGDRPPSTAAEPAVMSPPAPRSDPRLRLVRDVSAVLAVGALAILVVANLSAVGGSSGGVLSATATPAVESVQAAPDVSAEPSPSASLPIVPPPSEVVASGPSEGGSVIASAQPASSAAPAATRSSASLALLAPCPDRPDCYVYVVRRGDNLTRISSQFGIPTVTILGLNPTITDPSLIVTGDRLILPTPTR